MEKMEVDDSRTSFLEDSSNEQGVKRSLIEVNEDEFKRDRFLHQFMFIRQN